jgi:flagellar biogenesis protein FliO
MQAVRAFPQTKMKLFQMVTEMRQQSPARQMFGHFGAIALILIVVAGLCWGFTHI